jgi:hypothetical protein
MALQRGDQPAPEEAQDERPYRRVIARDRASPRRTTTMDDLKKDYREGEETAKEAWRKADGEEDLADKIGNAGDDIRKELGNAGDRLGEEMDRQTGDDMVDDRDRL